MTRRGDRVLVVGGGFGVTSVWAAKLVGEKGRVVCYEGALDRICELQMTARLNDVEHLVEVHHPIVGEHKRLFGRSGGARIAQPSELEECDVLEMDCEGAEISILANMLIEPRCIVVETHGFNGASTAKVTMLLEKRGYHVEDTGVAVSHKAAYCEENDIKVLKAVKSTRRC